MMRRQHSQKMTIGPKKISKSGKNMDQEAIINAVYLDGDIEVRLQGRTELWLGAYMVAAMALKARASKICQDFEILPPPHRVSIAAQDEMEAWILDVNELSTFYTPFPPSILRTRDLWKDCINHANSVEF